MRYYYKNLAIHCQGDYHRMVKLLEKDVAIPHYHYSGQYVTIVDEAYPKALFDLEYKPLVLFYEGNLDIINKSVCVSIIGSRKPSVYALGATEKLVYLLREKYTIVSGLAYGIDICAHINSLDFKGVAVLGCGIDVVYPKAHTWVFDKMCKDHCILSEYPKGVQPKKHHFPFRNRIIAALSKRLYVMAATHQSGTIKTVEEAVKINRDIYCLPHNIFELSGQGCNALIADGAGVISTLDTLEKL